MKIFSTFSGIGGFEIGISNALEATRLLQGLDHEAGQASDGAGALRPEPSVIGYSEIDRYATSVYEYHFPGVTNYGDITKINANELPDFDCLVGGFPCQAFSIAGKRKGFEDTRGTLFFDLARILRAKQPRLFVFENVKGLLGHDNGRTFKTIIQTIDELGYDCQWQVLNSKDFGVPQNRERVYIVGHLRGTPRPEVFPIFGNNGKDIETIIDSRHDHQRVYSRDGISPTINTGQRGNAQPKVVDFNRKEGVGKELTEAHTLSAKNYRGLNRNQSQTAVIHVHEATKKGYAEATPGQAINLSQPNSKTRRGRVSDIAPTLDTGMQLHTLTEDVRIRRLTPLETERLQGFPDQWTAEGIDGAISDSQRYKMCGNAVTTNVVQAVFERIFESTMEANQ